MDEDLNLLERLREEIALAESNLAGAMRGISDGYLELHNGGGRGHSVHAQYQESNMRTGKPLADLAVELAAWASEIAAKSAALDVRRTLLKQFEEEG